MHLPIWARRANDPLRQCSWLWMTFLPFAVFAVLPGTVFLDFRTK
jgi:hypothetical protein